MNAPEYDLFTGLRSIHRKTRWSSSKCFKKYFRSRFRQSRRITGRSLHTSISAKYISDTELCPFDIALKNAGVQHKLIPPRTPWHNGKVERSHRNDQRYFYNWEKFASVEDLNRKLKDHLRWSNRKPMRTLGGKSPLDLLREILSNAWFFSIPLFFIFCGSYLFTTQRISGIYLRNTLTLTVWLDIL